uniref:Uncharacterized protein n=2 Tax=Setaria viridis TaxID=4556 RepID=A0A4U6SS38_SETVI|nr:hypothetical protein SEVIR_9G063500v2 [Setaria viridis]
MEATGSTIGSRQARPLSSLLPDPIFKSMLHLLLRRRSHHHQRRRRLHDHRPPKLIVAGDPKRLPRPRPTAAKGVDPKHRRLHSKEAEALSKKSSRSILHSLGGHTYKGL